MRKTMAAIAAGLCLAGVAGCVVSVDATGRVSPPTRTTPPSSVAGGVGSRPVPAPSAAPANSGPQAVVAARPDPADGRPGTQVDLGTVVGIVPTADGGLYVAGSAKNRVWKLRSDGTMVKVAGDADGAVDPAADFQGVPGTGVALGTISWIGSDGQDGLLIREQRDASNAGNVRVSRLGADGRLSRIFVSRGGERPVALIPRPDGQVLMFSNFVEGKAAQRWALRPGAEPKLERTYAAAEIDQAQDRGAVAILRRDYAAQVGVDGQGGVYLGVFPHGSEIVRYDVGTDRFRTVATFQNGFHDCSALDGAGNLFRYEQAAGTLKVAPAGGGREVFVFQQVPPELLAAADGNRPVQGGALTADGTAYTFVSAGVFRWRDGRANLVAGSSVAPK